MFKIDSESRKISKMFPTELKGVSKVQGSTCEGGRAGGGDTGSIDPPLNQWGRDWITFPPLNQRRGLGVGTGTPTL